MPADVLDGSLPTQVDGAVLDQIGDRLPALAEPLARYVGADASVDPRDEQLLTAVDRLRRSLEAVYGQRLTLDGEDRPPTGTRVDVEQLLDEVEGYVVGIQADQIDRDTHLNVDQKAKKVAPGGTLHGAVLGSIGRSTP